MADVPIFCPYCGKQRDSTKNPDAKFCEFCGKPIQINNSKNKVSSNNYIVLLKYEPGWYLVTPKVCVSLGDENILLTKKETKKLSLPAGQYHFEFSSSVRKNKLDLNLNGNIEIIISWNRLTGQLTVETKIPKLIPST